MTYTHTMRDKRDTMLALQVSVCHHLLECRDQAGMDTNAH